MSSPENRIKDEARENLDQRLYFNWKKNIKLTKTWISSFADFLSQGKLKISIFVLTLESNNKAFKKIDIPSPIFLT